MSRIGIQLKPDHPALRAYTGEPRVFRRLHGEPTYPQHPENAALILPYVHEVFRVAYGLSGNQLAEMLAKGVIEAEFTEDGCVWVYFVSDLSKEDAEKVISAIRRLG